MQKNKFKIPYKICIVLVFILGITFFLLSYVEDKMYKTNATHVQEVYNQVNSSFTTIVSRNWKLLIEWGITIGDMLAVEGEEALAEYLQGSKQRWGITDLYFLSENGDYIRLDGEQGHFSLEHELGHAEGFTVTSVKQKDGNNLTVFTSPAPENTYRNFSYNTLGISFDNDALETELNIATYGGNASSYIVFPDGRSLFSYNAITQQTDYFARLENDAKFIKGSAKEFRETIQNGENNTFMIQVDGIKYFLVCQNLNFLNWKLLGLVPEQAVNADFLVLQLLSIGLVSILLLTLMVISIIYLRRISKQQILKKDVALKHQEQMFGILVNQTSDIFIMSNTDSLTPEYVSPNVERLLGIPAEDVLKDMSLLSQTLVPNAEQSQLGLTYSSPDQHLCEHIHQQTGERRWFQETIYHSTLENVNKVILVMSERTQEVESHQRLEVAMNLVKSANEAKSNFLSSMSHDIRTPINAIIGFSLLLHQDAENHEKVRDYTRKITSSSRYLLSLINDILDMSKIESGKATLNVAEFQLGTLLEDIHVVIQPQAVAKNQTFDLKINSIRDDLLLGDQLRISQVLQNLLTNAIKYTPTGGHIQLIVTQLVSTSDSFSRLQFEVIDNGMGISEEYQKVMFDSFTREANTTISGIQGTGLGLAITKNLVDLMGGTIQVKSKKDHGSAFTVTLDLRIPETDWKDNFEQECGIHRILIVDDEKNLCLDIQNIISSIGLEAEYTTDGEKAVEMVQQAIASNQPYDLILLDWVLDSQGGTCVDIAKRISDQVKDTAILMVMSAYARNTFEHEAREAGVHAFMPKPFFLTAFCKTIQQIRRNIPCTEQSTPTEECSISGLRILAAEDNELNAEILFELLELEEATCDIAENGQVAVEKFCASKPGYYDVILMDVQMPVMNGYEATQAIRRSSHPDSTTIPIAAMTANAFTDDIQTAFDSGMNAHIAKPIDMNVLKTTVAKLVSK